MEFLWPGFLFLLGLIPLARRAVYLDVAATTICSSLFQPRIGTRRFAQKSQTGAAISRLSCFCLASPAWFSLSGRPVAILNLPTNQTTIILTIDVSGSMRSRDIQPSRLQAAEEAAFSFVQHQKSNTQIGLVAFSTFAEIIQPATTDQAALQAALDSLTVGRRTAIGSGILVALDAISQVDKNVARSITDTQPGVEPTPVPKGDYAPDIIVLLTDGDSNTGPDPVAAAQQAVDRGVRIYTIGFGTQTGPIPPKARLVDSAVFQVGVVFWGEVVAADLAAWG